MKKLLLTFPNQRWHKQDVNTTWNLYPSTLCLLAEMVKDIVEVKIIDAQFYNLSIEEFINKTREYSPDYVGISVLTSEYGDILNVAANAIKEIDNSIVVIAGGVYPTIDYKTVMSNRNIDYCVRGEGEHVLPELLSFIMDSKKNKIPNKGIVYYDDDKLVVTPRAFVQDLKDLPWPDYSLVNLNDYLNYKSVERPIWQLEPPSLRLIVTRGCPVGCSFCQVEYISGKAIRTRDPVDIVNELEHLKNTYGIKSLIFEDDNISLQKKFFMQLLELMIEKKLNLKWIIQAFAIFTLTDKMLNLMVQAGCVGVNVAIESGNQRVMNDLVLKPLKLEKVPPLINKIKDAGLFVYANFIIGFPGETWDEIRETIRFAESCGADYIKCFIAMPLSHTKMLDMAIEKNVLDTGESNTFIDWRFGQITSDEWTAKDISILRAYEWDRINFSTEEKRKRLAELWGVTIEDIQRIRKQTRDSLTF